MHVSGSVSWLSVQIGKLVLKFPDAEPQRLKERILAAPQTEAEVLNALQLPASSIVRTIPRNDALPTSGVLQAGYYNVMLPADPVEPGKQHS